eukprot:351825-Chlamydomonas_euryale.AAC.1
MEGGAAAMGFVGRQAACNRETCNRVRRWAGSEQRGRRGGSTWEGGKAEGREGKRDEGKDEG